MPNWMAYRLRPIRIQKPRFPYSLISLSTSESTSRKLAEAAGLGGMERFTRILMPTTGSVGMDVESDAETRWYRSCVTTGSLSLVDACAGDGANGLNVR